jgi:hypothetical protein
MRTTFDVLDEVELRLGHPLSRHGRRGNGGRVPRAKLVRAGARLATMRRWVRNEQAIFERAGLETEALLDSGAGQGMLGVALLVQESVIPLIKASAALSHKACDDRSPGALADWRACR